MMIGVENPQDLNNQNALKSQTSSLSALKMFQLLEHLGF
jgi:hypothetical protein